MRLTSMFLPPCSIAFLLSIFTTLCTAIPYSELFEDDIRSLRRRTPQSPGASPVPIPAGDALCTTSNFYISQAATIANCQQQAQLYLQLQSACIGCSANPTQCDSQTAQLCRQLASGSNNASGAQVVTACNNAVNAYSATAAATCPSNSNFESCCQATYTAALPH